jgi:hypothetical protein
MLSWMAAGESGGVVAAQCKPPVAAIAAAQALQCHDGGYLDAVLPEGEDVSAGLAVFFLYGHEEPYIH